MYLGMYVFPYMGSRLNIFFSTSTGAEEKVNLSPPKKMTVEELIAYMDYDELLEVTPKNVRLRKKLLDSGERERWNRSQRKAAKN
jgi:GTP-binding protein